MSLQLMKERVQQSGASLYDEQIKDAQDALAYGFNDDVSHAKQVFFWVPGENPRKGEHLDVKLYDRKYSAANGNTQKFLTRHTDVVEVGDYVYNEKDNTYWICTESFNIDDVHFEGKFTQCNWVLRWQRPDGTILEYPCQDINATQYNSGEAGSATMTLGSSQHMETVQATEDTLALASPKRFYIGRGNNIPYVVTQNDTTACYYGKGLCKITVMQDVNRDGIDRPDLGICDYISPTTPPENDDKTTILNGVISGSDSLKLGFTRTYTATVTGKDGNNISWSDDDFYWNIYPAKDVILNIDKNKVSILAEDESLIGNTIRIEVRYRGILICSKDVEITEAF